MTGFLQVFTDEDKTCDVLFSARHYRTFSIPFFNFQGGFIYFLISYGLNNLEFFNKIIAIKNNTGINDKQYRNKRKSGTVFKAVVIKIYGKL